MGPGINETAQHACRMYGTNLKTFNFRQKFAMELSEKQEIQANNEVQIVDTQ